MLAKETSLFSWFVRKGEGGRGIAVESENKTSYSE